MRLTTVQSWVTLLMIFALLVTIAWICHDVLTRSPKTAAHRQEQYDGLEVFDD